jgi:hypothetical protein
VVPKKTEIKNCIISSYGETDFLGAHCDEDLERSLSGRGRNSFYFGEKIIGVILYADPKGGLYLLDAQNHPDVKDKPEQFHLHEVDGLPFLLSGVNRYRFHGVSPIASKRISLTFRTVHICP